MTERSRRAAGWILLGLLLGALVLVVLLLRFSVATDHLYHALVKDPERRAPAGNVIVAPADGTVLYVRRVSKGTIPYIIKRGVRVPVAGHLKNGLPVALDDGYLIGIYMNTHGVHINRVPDTGTLEHQSIYNGPHMDMTEAETGIILSQLVPGWITFRKLLGMDPFGIEDDSDYILKSARETLTMRDRRGRGMYIVRIADYYVGKILTWIRPGEKVARGQKLGMIAWGSQTDVLFENSPGLTVEVDVGDYVYGGETVIARY